VTAPPANVCLSGTSVSVSGKATDPARLLSIPEIKTDVKKWTDRKFSPDKQRGWIVCGLDAGGGGVYADYNTAEYLPGYASVADAKAREKFAKIWGAKLMIKEGVLADPRPDAVFGLHVTSGLPVGRIGYRGGPAMASADELRIKVTGRQGHAGYPWRTVDPVTTAAQIVLGVQTIVSRRTDLMKSPTVVSISTINGGSRFNIVPETVEMTGTVRTYDAGVRKGVHADIKQVAENIAASANAKAEVEIIELYDPLVNPAAMATRMAPVLERAANGDIQVVNPTGAAEDFSFFLNDVPGLFFNVGVVPRDQDLAKAAPNHSPNFFVDEKALVVGVRALAFVTLNYLAGAKTD